MQIERDVSVTTRDGSPIVVNVFRPEGDGPFPVIASCSPYGKDIFWPDRFPMYDEADQGEHAVWETPDPVWWTERGYALVRIDIRGTGKSPGYMDLGSRKDAEDFYDVIEWCGTQPWSNGKVATSGISWYAMSGWRAAELKPPHLAALIAWEGATDCRREWTRHGGMQILGLEGWWDMQIEPQRNGETYSHLLKELKSRKLNDAWYEERTVDLSQIEVPLLSAANWGSVHLHLRGNIEGYVGAVSPHKWLVIQHGSHIGPYYEPWAKDLQLRFLERFLKGREDAMDGQAPVRVAVRHGREIEWRDEAAWPLPGTQWQTYYLDQQALVQDPPSAGEVTYPATFDFVAKERIEFTGQAALRLWVKSVAEDMDVFVRLEQFDVDGTRIPAPGPNGYNTPIPMAVGWLRASLRKTDPAKSLPWRPWHPQDEYQPMEPGKPTLLEVELWPTSITLEPGQRLQLQLVPTDMDLGKMLSHADPDEWNDPTGAQILLGGDYPSSLLLPHVPTNRPGVKA